MNYNFKKLHIKMNREKKIGSRQLYTMLFFKMGKITACLHAIQMVQREGKIGNIGNIILESISRKMSLDRHMGTRKINLR